MPLTRGSTLAWLGAASALLGASRAGAEEPQSTIAEVLFRDAQQLLADGRVSEACSKFRASQKADPALGTLLNLAVCHEREGKTATAWVEYSEAASAAHNAGDTAREKYAQARQSNLEPTLHRVALDAEEHAEGLVLYLDRTSVLPAAFGIGIPLDPGEHELRATAPARAPWSWHFTTTAEPGTERITIPRLKPEHAATPPAPVAAPPPATAAAATPASESTPPGEDSRWSLDARHGLAYGSGAIAVVGLGTGIYFAISAANHASRRDELCKPGVACYDQHAYHEHHLAEVANRWMLVTAGVGLLAAGAAAGLLLVPWSEQSEHRAGTWRAQPLIGAGTLGALASGEF